MPVAEVTRNTSVQERAIQRCQRVMKEASMRRLAGLLEHLMTIEKMVDA